MKDIKTKVTSGGSADVISTNGSSGPLKPHSLATEEQIRVAKLSQVNTKEEQNIKDNIKSISEITGEPPDIAALALHDCHYDYSTAIQNILDGMYKQEQDGWETTKTRKGKKNVSGTVPSPSNTNHSETTQKTINKSKNMDSSNVGAFEEPSEQKMSAKSARYVRGGLSGQKGRSLSRNWRNDDHPSNDEKTEPSNDRESSREGIRSSVDRGRGRGRGRGGFRGNMSRGARGSRGGFSRGGGFRGNSRQQRGGFSTRGGVGKSHDDKVIENGNFEETWDVGPEEDANPKVGDWSDDVVEDNADWSKAEWVKDKEVTENSGSLFSSDAKWSQMNGVDTPKDSREKYIPEHIDTAVIRSVPTSSTAGEVTSYQPTNDLSRYMTTASNQFPSSHQDGGLTNSLNDRTFSLPSGANPSDPITHGVPSVPMVSGITESHKLEQEQMHASKSQCTSSKPRRSHNKYVQLPSQPVVMPRSAQMVNDIEEQFTGLEFGSAPISPRFKKTVVEQENIVMPSSSSSLASQHVVEESARRHLVASLQNEPMLPSSSHGVTAQSLLASSPGKNLDSTKNDITKTPPGFKPLDQSRYLGSTGRGITHMGADAMSFPSTNNHTSPTPSASLNVFSRNGGLGTSVSGNDQQSLSYSDQQMFEKREKSITAEKVMAEQRALAEKQILAEHQRVLSQRVRADQIAFAEQKSIAQQKLLACQRSQEDSSFSDRLSSDLSDRTKLPDNRLGISDPSLHDRQTSMDKTQLSSNDNGFLSSKIHSSSSASSHSSSPHVTMQPSYNNTTSSEMVGLTSATGVQTTPKALATSNKVSSAPPPGVVPQMNMYAGVQHGMIPTFQHQPMHGYNYEDMLTPMQRLPVSPYGYDVSMFQAAGGAPAGTARDGLQTYPQGSDSKYTRSAEEAAVSIQGNPPHVAAGNMNPHQQAAYLNAAAGQLPYGYYAYQPNVLPQYPASAIYQVQQGKGVPGTTYQSQYQGQQQPGYNSTKFSGGSGHDYSKASYQSSIHQQPLSQHVKPAQHNATSSAIQSTSHQAVPQSVFKSSHYNQDGKGFLGNSPTSLNAQASLQLHNQAAHVGNMNHFLMQQQVGATHLGHHHVDPSTHRNQVHGQMPPFSANQQKRDHKGNYQSYWSAPR